MKTSMEVRVIELETRKGKEFLSFFSAMDMERSKERAIHLVTDETVPSKTHLDYCLVRRSQ